MGKKGKAGIIILVILLILSLAGAGTGFYYFREERLKVIALDKDLKNLRLEERLAESKLTESKKRLEELNSQFQIARTQIGELNSKLEEAESQKGRFYSQIEGLESQLREQEEIKREWESERVQTQEKVDELQAEIQRLQASEDRLKAQIDKLEDKKKVALGRVVVGQSKGVKEASVLRPTSPPVPPALEGKVLVVNKEYDFAVINLGSRDGLNPDEMLSVYQQGDYIGDIRIEKTQETMSACGFVSRKIKDNIREGDKVSLGRVVVGQNKGVEEASVLRPTSPPVPPALEGKVLAVNKEYDFAVINLGSRNGLNPDEVFSVYQQGDYIGDIRIDKTQEIMSSCVFVSKAVRERVREGDKVIKR